VWSPRSSPTAVSRHRPRRRRHAPHAGRTRDRRLRCWSGPPARPRCHGPRATGDCPAAAGAATPPCKLGPPKHAGRWWSQRRASGGGGALPRSQHAAGPLSTARIGRDRPARKTTKEAHAAFLLAAMGRAAWRSPGGARGRHAGPASYLRPRHLSRVSGWIGRAPPGPLL
jgi:hypothetical protein